MSHNPYSPPSTTVADFDHGALLVRPRSATIGIRLLWVIMILSLVGTVSSLVAQTAGAVNSGDLAPVVLTIALVFCVVIYVLLFWLLWAAGKGKNWGRVTITVLMVIGITYVLITTPFNLRAAPVETSIMLLVLGLEILAIVLLFLPDSTAWYSAKRSAT